MQNVKVIARDLVVGDVVGSGEQVLRISKIGKFNNVKLFVTLKHPNGKVRLACWAYFSVISIQERKV